MIYLPHNFDLVYSGRGWNNFPVSDPTLPYLLRRGHEPPGRRHSSFDCGRRGDERYKLVREFHNLLLGKFEVCLYSSPIHGGTNFGFVSEYGEEFRLTFNFVKRGLWSSYGFLYFMWDDDSYSGRVYVENRYRLFLGWLYDQLGV